MAIERNLFSSNFATSKPLEERYLEMDAATLAAEIEHHDALYFTHNAAQISDALYDRLKERLRELEPGHALFSRIEPASQGKIRHASPMLSLDKAYDFGKIRDWYHKFAGAAVGSPKIDGLACSINYDGQGRLQLALTRGDGSKGEDITENVKFVGDIPQKVAAAFIEVRGEIYMPLSKFRQFSGDFANPRNLAAGGVKLKNAAESAVYGLRFFAYDLRNEPWSTEAEKWKRLEELGFVCAPWQLVSESEIEVFCDRILGLRGGYDFETDGIVFKTNDCAEQERLGLTSHHPRYGIAFKFQGDSSTSTLLGVHWQVARSGTITPVAQVEPVVLSGAKVSKASLHNLSILESLDLGLGDEVELTRRGGVIPHVERVVQHAGAKLEIPSHCPSCGSMTQRRGDFLFCTRPEDCVAGRAARLEHFAKVIDCKGFGGKIIAQLMALDLLSDPEDFFDLSVVQLMQIGKDRRQDKAKSDVLAKKLYAQIQASRRVSLAQFLQALGIESLGKSQSTALATHFMQLQGILDARIEDFMQIDGFAEISARAVYEGLQERREMIEALCHEMQIEAVQIPQMKSQELPFAGRSFLFTGELNSMKRKDAEERVRALGGSIASGVSKKLSVLVAASQGHGKWQKAVQLNEEGGQIALWNEAQFLEAIA